jgi:hypothetical protein
VLPNRYDNYGYENAKYVIYLYKNFPNKISLQTLSGFGPGGNRFVTATYNYTPANSPTVNYPAGSFSPYTENRLYDFTTVATSNNLKIDTSNTPIPLLSAGSPIVLRETTDPINIDGSGIVTRVIRQGSAGSNTPTSFIVTMPRVASDSLFVAPSGYKTQYTTMYTGGFFTGAELPITGLSGLPGTTDIQVTTATPKKLYINQPIYLISTENTVNTQFGPFSINNIVSDNSFTYSNTNAISAYIAITNLLTPAARLYVRPTGVALHRSTDGGVQINTGDISPYSQIIRQTRKYFRYQSGKSILFSTGLLFKPSYDIQNLTVSPGIYSPAFPFYTITVTTEQDHGFTGQGTYSAGTQVRLTGLNVLLDPNPYNTIYNVQSVVSNKTFTLNLPVSSLDSAPVDLSPGGIGRVEAVSWYDGVVRSGMFDEQNGIYFQYDGQKFAIGRRDSVTNLTGTVNLTASNTIVTGNNTKFLGQLDAGDYCVIKGMAYKVDRVFDDTSIQISPDYRGPSTTRVKITKTIDRIVNQDNFNLDKLDGSGPSGYVIDLNKMQMIYFDYSWYGAGRIRWGVRATTGDIVYCHEMPNNNVNAEAYMRSGNLPARFEIINRPQQGTILRSNGTRVSVTNTVSPSAILVNIVKSANPRGPFSSFSPPISSFVFPYQDIPSNTAFIYSLDMNGTNTGAIKIPPDPFNNPIELRNGAAYSNFSKFGAGSVRLSSLTGTISYNIPIGRIATTGQGIPNSWTSGDFSIECFVLFNSFRSNDTPYNVCPDPIIFGNSNYYTFGGAQDYGFNVRAAASSGSTTQIKTGLAANQYEGSSIYTSSTNVLTLSTWHHVVWQRKNYVTKVFVDGVPVISTPDNRLYNMEFYYYTPVFGATAGGSGGGLMGYVDEIRGVFQTAPYPVEGFVPPTQPFAVNPDQSQRFAPVIDRDIVNLENNYYTAYTVPTAIFPYRQELQSTQTVTTTATTLIVSPSSTFFIPNTGTILIGQEYINYNNIGIKSTGDQVIKLVNRNIGGLTNIPEHNIMQNNINSNNRVLSLNNNCSPALSHWGTSVIMDGEFTEDKSYLFTASMSGFITPQLSAVDYPLISIRLAPAADYGVGSTVGLRNLINRSIITLNDVQIVTRQAANIIVKINGDSPLWAQSSKWLPAGNGSIAQYMDHSTNIGNISGGVTVLGFLAGEQDIGRNQVTDQEISIIRNLGNSILGGNKAFPDGPDILTVYARPFASSPTNRTLAKISWLEAQG